MYHSRKGEDKTQHSFILSTFFNNFTVEIASASFDASGFYLRNRINNYDLLHSCERGFENQCVNNRPW